MPFELRPHPNPTLRPEERYLQEAWSRSVYPFAARLGVEIHLPRVSPQPHTHLAWEGFQFAREAGRADEYNHRVLAAFFQESQDIGQVEVLTALAGEVGLDQAVFRAALETRRYREAHLRALEHAYSEARITSVPTFVIGRQQYPGVLDRKTLEERIDRELQRHG